MRHCTFAVRSCMSPLCLFQFPFDFRSKHLCQADFNGLFFFQVILVMQQLMTELSVGEALFSQEMTKKEENNWFTQTLMWNCKPWHFLIWHVTNFLILSQKWVRAESRRELCGQRWLRGNLWAPRREQWGVFLRLRSDWLVPMTEWPKPDNVIALGQWFYRNWIAIFNHECVGMRFWKHVRFAVFQKLVIKLLQRQHWNPSF